MKKLLFSILTITKMKKHFLFLALVSLLSFNMQAQCDVANTSIIEGFNASTLPDCWTLLSRTAFTTTTRNTLSGNALKIYLSAGVSDAQFVLPKTITANGILKFKASNTTNGQLGYGAFVIGAVTAPNDMASFEPITTVNVYATVSGGYIVGKEYTADLTSYVGNKQYIAIKVASHPGYIKELYVDNFVFEAGCISENVNAIAKDITVQLDNTGNVTVMPSDVDNGSTADCNDPTFSLDVAHFTCSDLGVNAVTLTATDNAGNTSTASATITVLPFIEDELVMADQESICIKGSATVSTDASVVGVEYYLRNDLNDTIVDGPISGDGNALTFNTGEIDQTTTYNVYAEPKIVWTGLKFDGVNDYVLSSTDNRGINSQVTIAAWIKSTATGATQFIANKYDAVNGYILYFTSTGKAGMDGRDGAAYKSSGISTTSVNDGQWHYITGTINTSTGVWSIYVDGVLENSTNNAAGGSLASTTALGVGLANPSYYFTGSIDGFSLSDVALNQTEIQAMMNSCLTGTESNLVALFNFNEATGSIATDLSTSAIDGVLTNMDINTVWEENDFSCGVSCPFEMTEKATVTVTDVLDMSVSMSGNEITANELNATYRWLDCNDSHVAIDGETGMVFTANVNGDYAVEVTKNACVDTSDCVNALTVGLTSIDSPTLSIYPNPTAGQVNIHLGDLEDVSVNVSSETGVLIYEETGVSDIHQFEFEGAPGLYFMEVSSQGESQVFMLIKE